MKQEYIDRITKEVQDLLVNHKNRVIHSTADYQIITIGRLQIEPLDWYWVINDGAGFETILKYKPYDWMFRYNRDSKGVFSPVTYGLSYHETPPTLTSYKTLWKFGTKPDDQVRIMWNEMKKKGKQRVKKCKNGIKVLPGTDLWMAVDALATKTRTLMTDKIKDLEEKHISYDGEKLLDTGVKITPEILGLVDKLRWQLSK